MACSTQLKLHSPSHPSAVQPGTGAVGCKSLAQQGTATWWSVPPSHPPSPPPIFDPLPLPPVCPVVMACCRWAPQAPTHKADCGQRGEQRSRGASRAPQLQALCCRGPS